MPTEFVKMEPEDQEYRFILEREVEQWYQVEDLVRKYAFVDEDMIIFLTPTRSSKTKSLFEPLLRQIYS